MRRLLTTSVLVLGLAITSPALSKSSQKYDATFVAPANSALKVEVVIGDDLAYRANNLPKRLKDRNSSRRFNAGFANNGFYGERDLDRLADRLSRKVTQRLTQKGVEVSDTAGTTLRLVLTDARPNRPTYRQLSKEPSLSSQSIGLGGAEFEGQLLAASGDSLGDVSYAYFETDIRDAGFGGTWADANRAIDRFARKTAKTLAK